MEKLSLITLAFAVGAAATTHTEPQQFPYTGYKVVRVPVQGDVSKVVGIIEKLGLETWQGPHETAADIVVSPEKLHDFNHEVAGIDVQVMHEDLGASIAAESQPAEGVVFSTSDAVINSSWFTSYHRYLDHLQFLEDLVAQHPNHSEIVTSGKSFEGNDISAIHIYGSSGKGVKPAIVFHGTVHAREWITTMVVEYFADFLLDNYDTEPEIRAFVDKYDFYIYPVVNPDGFIYTQTHDRMWRKNRQHNVDNACVGTDMNRNWPYKWGPSPDKLKNPAASCTETHPGNTGGDTPEILALTEALLEIESEQGLKLYIDWHSYSQVILTPYGDCDHLAEDNDEMQSIASGAAESMSSLYGTLYTSGTICAALYPAQGTSIDYVKDVVGGDYSFGVELRDRGVYGFVLPPDQILPNSLEAFEGVKYLLRNMK